MAALSNEERLRLFLGENIPAGGDEADTMFTNAQLQDFLAQAGSLGLIKAAVYGWQAKAGEYSNLVDVAEGNSSRAMSDLYKAALAMVKFYEDQLGTGDDPTLQGRSGRVVIGTISRAGQGRR